MTSKTVMHLLIVITLFFTYCNSNGKNKIETNQSDTSTKDSSTVSSSEKDTLKDSSDSYNYDTTLKGGYSLSFKTEDSLEYLYLKKDQPIKLIAFCSRGLPYKNLGYKGADFTDYFVLAHSFGSRNPTYIELIKKSTGQNVLKNGSAWIGANESEELLLYSEIDIPSEKDKMTLYNIKTGHKKLFDFPKHIFDEPMVLNRIHIDTITDNHLIIEYETKNGLIKQAYNR